MENKLAKIMMVLAILGLVAGPVAYAEPPEGGPEDEAIQPGGPGDQGPKGGEEGMEHGRPGPKDFFKGLNLTQEQKEKLKAQREAKKESGKALRDQMKTKMQALHEAIAKPGTTRADVNGLLSEVNELKGQMFAQMVDGIFSLKEVLTPEQFAKMQEQHKEWMSKKHEGGGGKNHGPKQD